MFDYRCTRVVRGGRRLVRNELRGLLESGKGVVRGGSCISARGVSMFESK